MPKVGNHIILLMASIVLMQGVSMGILFSQFQAQSDSIESKFCENKARTDFDCGGQCYFMKKMNAASNPLDAEESQTQVLINFQPVFFQSIVNFTFENLDSTRRIENESILSLAHVNDLLKPPQKA